MVVNCEQTVIARKFTGCLTPNEVFATCEDVIEQESIESNGCEQ